MCGRRQKMRVVAHSTTSSPPPFPTLVMEKPGADGVERECVCVCVCVGARARVCVCVCVCVCV